MMRLFNPNMHMGMEIVNVVANAHVCIDVYHKFLPYSNVHCLGRLFESPLPLPLLLGGHMH